jgi:hypothetical protein
MRSLQQKYTANGATIGAGEANCALVSRWIADKPVGWTAAGWDVRKVT